MSGFRKSPVALAGLLALAVTLAAPLDRHGFTPRR
jgi:hypothetical protein